MNSNNRFIAAAVLALSAGVALAQETAGRVIAAVGDVVIEREGRRLPAITGAPVMTGDQLVLGAQSNAQIRLSDQSIIALRPETVFKLTEYAFQGQPPERQRSSFELVKGGMRTVTGLIGRALNRPEAYSVVTPTATIGIRGTHYSLVHCDGGCRGPGGAVAPNGTYGAVTDGRIAVTNQAGERVFGADQYFQVASRNASPQQLVAPPSFLRDRLEGRARARDRQQETQQARAQGGQGQQGQQGQGSQGSPAPQGPQGSQGSPGAPPAAPTPASAGQTGSESAGTFAQTGLGATSGDTGITGSVSGPAPTVLPQTTLTNTFVANETQSPTGIASTIQSSTSGTIFYRLAGPFSIPVSCASPPCASIISGDLILGVNYTLQRAFVRVAIGTNDSTLVNAGTPPNTDGIPITLSGGAVNFGITINRADYPTQQGAFRCFGCGSGNSGMLTYLDSISVSGTISGATASLTFTGVDSSGAHTFSATLSQATPPNTDAGATIVPASGGSGSALSSAYWDVAVDSQRRLTSIGPSVGGPRASVGSATNVLVGSAPAAGNLAWGYWSGSGAQLTDSSYQSYTTSGPSTAIPWITGSATNTLPTALGSTSYTMVGSLVNGGSGTLNSASLSADFVNRTMSVSLNATNPLAGATFQMSGSSGISAVNSRFSAGFSSVTCSGSCGGSAGGSFSGFFSGAQAEGAGLSFFAGAGPSVTVGGVAAFKR